ncbi:MAG: DUF134 domain-containing protein [Candidatus Marinimicrobia bacterium]|jgi:predicted DNA-binding protein (UPF0251 family)|nr:DUF134 domain-containing protein [Candidatus Neomarinimicrobiota bacterium]MBT4361390.1 DUF134 domain-containing protein [Candidatus Neomarinimicrobiota bacterium]MBT4713170.1 DUF134 domain-containing protein [Candidatus Neomarinimicrobiota bacterium]MBT4947499.1 DUF134 domain-containing protein [Candidatus Neomarinimicrobiota bacterium]MBT5313537.1 DUF134 domain-containing protein [Candidatus Neomarinimicrobiota bacterium]
MNNAHSPKRHRSRGAYRRRRIASPPRFGNFKPSGIPRISLKQVVITLDEYEAFRLADFEGYDHLEASVQMDISRPTFSRLIEKARSKVAHAIVEGLELVIEGGNIDFSQGMHRCLDCGDEQLHALNKTVDDCPECGSEDMEDLTSKYLTSKKRKKGSTS